MLADIPGLIEGASEGAGLGHEFLAHVERTRLLLHLVDIAPVDGCRQSRYSRRRAGRARALRRRPRDAGRSLLVLSKVDLLPEDGRGRASTRWRASCANEPTCSAGETPAGPRGVERDRGRGLAALSRRDLPATPEPAGGRPLPTPASRSPSTPSTGRPSVRNYRSSAAASAFPRLGPGGRAAHPSSRSRQPGGARLHRGAFESDGCDQGARGQGFEPGEEVAIGDVAFELYPGTPQRRRDMKRRRKPP